MMTKFLETLSTPPNHTIGLSGIAAAPHPAINFTEQQYLHSTLTVDVLVSLQQQTQQRCERPESTHTGSENTLVHSTPFCHHSCTWASISRIVDSNVTAAPARQSLWNVHACHPSCANFHAHSRCNFTDFFFETVFVQMIAVTASGFTDRLEDCCKLLLQWAATVSVNPTTVSNPVGPNAVLAQPVVIVKQFQTPKPYLGQTSHKSFRERFERVAKANGWLTELGHMQNLAWALDSPAIECQRGQRGWSRSLWEAKDHFGPSFWLFGWTWDGYEKIWHIKTTGRWSRVWIGTVPWGLAKGRWEYERCSSQTKVWGGTPLWRYVAVLEIARQTEQFWKIGG